MKIGGGGGKKGLVACRKVNFAARWGRELRN